MTEKTTISGVLNIDKPAGITSHDIVAQVRRLVPGKVGHAGTLDPFATGVLLVAVGPATRLIQFSHAWDKEYAATFILGATSDTDDVTGTITPPNLPLSGEEKNTPPDKGEIEGVLKNFIGTIEQLPPAYSAVKIKGKKLYQYAREKKVVGDIQPRNVTIHDIRVTRYVYPELDVHIRCGTGTYVRGIARDVGEQLGTGAFVSSLERTRSGLFDIQSSILLSKLSTGFQQYLHPPATLVSHLPKITLTSHNIKLLQQGQGISIAIPTSGPVALFTENEILMGVGTYNPTTSLLSPSINL